ncbi:TPA: phage tail assembly chaperone [Yersinia enterocolitica]
MGRQIEVVIGDTLFRGATSLARDQVEMLQIAAKSGLLPAINPNVTAMGMAASLASVDTMSLNRLKELCFNSGSIVRQSDNIPVGENLFQDEAHNYLVLLGQVLRENIGPFWQLSGEGKSAENNPQHPPA